MSDDFDPTAVAWVLTPKDLKRLTAAIAMSTEVVIDLETTGLDEHATDGGHTNGGYPARIALASLTLPQLDDIEGPTTWVVPLSHPDSPFLGRWVRVMRQIAVAIRDAERPVTNHNVKFDCRWINATCGMDLSWLIGWDTMIAAHLLDENSSTRLKDRAPQIFGVAAWDEFDLSVPGAAERVPMFDLGLYAARDTYWTWRLAVYQREQMIGSGGRDEPDTPDEVEDRRLGKLAVWCAMPTTATLTAVEQRGMVLDTGWVELERRMHQLEAKKISRTLARRYEGMDPDEFSFAPTSHWFRDWTAKAVDAGDLTVAELTPTGKPRWAKGVLVRQARGGSDVAQGILDFRGHTKKVEYLSSWLEYATPESTVHANYNAGFVVTGRLSSSSPNMQQVTAALKPAWVPRKGHVFADLDYGQIELRVAAFISRCEPMLEAFRAGEDLHSLLASRITGKPLDQVTAPERQAGKSANFGLLYGMGAYGFREYAEDVYGVSFTLDEAHLIHQRYFETWAGLQAWHAAVVHRAYQTGQVVSPIGRVRRVPGIWDANEKVASYNERMAINSPVQGFASDLMQIAAASIEGTLPGYQPVENARIVATVHDSILVEVPENDWKTVTLECQQRMMNVDQVLAKMDCHLDVPLVADAKVGTRWGLSDVAVIA